MPSVVPGLLIIFPFAAIALAQAPAFSPLASFPAQKAPLAIATADFNGDGILDLAVANAESATVSVFLGTGGGKFSAQNIFNLTVGCQAAYLAAASFTGAASPDLLAVCPLGDVVILPNMGSGAFGAPRATALPAGAWVGNLMLGSIHPAIADFNGDGFLDIVIPTFVSDLSDDSSGAWYLLLGKGNGSFQRPAALPFVGYLPLSIAAGDFNGDGQPDLVTVVSDPNGNLSLQFLANNSGTFSPPPSSIQVPNAIGSLLLVADVNGDGKLDVVVAGSSLVNNFGALTGSVTEGSSAVTVYLGDGAGNFKQSFNAAQQSYMSGAALANFLGTGKLDLVQTMIQENILTSNPPSGAIEIRPGNGDGTFESPITLPVSASVIPTDVAVADFNGDGRPDIVFSSVPAQGINALQLNSLNFGDILNQILSQFPLGDANILLNQTVAPTIPALTSGSVANGATYISGGLVPGSWAQVKGANLATVSKYVWQVSDFAGLGNDLPTNLKGTSVTVNGLPAAVYYVDPAQVNFQVPSGVSGTASVQVSLNGVAGNTVTGAGSTSSPGIFPVTVNGVNYAGGVFTDGKYIGDPAVSSAYRNATPGDAVQLFATGLVNSPAGVLVTQSPLSGVTITIGTVTFPADFAALVAVGEFQVNFTVPQQFANMAAGSYPIALTINGVSSPATINSVPPGPVVIPIQP